VVAVRPRFAAEIRKKRADRLRSWPQWRWHLDEIFVKINGERHYLWRAVDHEGEVLESFVAKARDRKEALKSLKKSMKRYGRPHILVTDKLRSYGAALKDIGAADRQETGPWAKIEQRIRTCRFDEENARYSASVACEVCRNSPPSIFKCTTISTRSATSTHDKTSSSAAPPLSSSGVNFVQGKFTLLAGF
jgi:putative transposase